jgi:hypothetical protein
MHQGKNGLAFVEALLAQKVYLGGVGLAATEGSAGARAMGRLGHEGEKEARACGRERGFGPETAQPRGGECFPFSFSNFYFLFLFLISLFF